MTTDGEVRIGVSLDTSQAEQQATQFGNKVGSQIDKSVTQATANTSQNAKKAVADIGAGLTSYGMAYTKAVTVPILAAGGASVAAAVKIDTALTGVRKTVDGTEQQYQELKQAAIEFSKTNAVDPAVILDIQALGAQLGYSIDELNLFGETVSGLDIATNMDAETAAMELAQFANIMGMAHDETKNYGSTIVDLGNHFATTESDISSMAMRIAGAGRQIGLTSADVLGLATALSSMGINAEAGGTAISTIMSSIDKDVALGTERLETWAQTANMTTEEFAAAWENNAVEALSAVLQGMESAVDEGGNMAVMLDELGISAIRQTDTLKRLASNSDFLGKAVTTANTAWEENIALDKEVENRNASLESQFTILKNKILAAAVDAGEPLAQALLDIIEVAEPLIEVLASGAKAFNELSDDQKKTIIQAIAIAAAFGPVTAGIGKMVTGVVNASNRWDAFGKNIKAVKDYLFTNQTALDKHTKSVTTNTTATKTNTTARQAGNTATKTATTTTAGLATATNTATASTKNLTTAQKLSTAAMNLGRGAALALGTAMKAIAPLAIISVITTIVSAVQSFNEESAKTQKLTTGMTDAVGRYNSALQSTRESLSDAATGSKSYADSLGDVIASCDDVIDAHLELSDKIGSTFDEAGTNNAMVENYIDTIRRLTDGYDELGNKTKNSASDQAELVSAVNGLNSIMGTSYSVVDAENGILSENRNMILQTADAWRERAKVEAAQQALIDLEKERIITNGKLTEAQSALEEETQKNIDAFGKLGDVQVWTSFEQVELEKKVSDLTAVMEDNEAATAECKNILNEYSETAATTADGLKGAISANEAFTQALDNASVDIDDFTQSIYSLGVSAADLSEIMKREGDAGIDGFVKAYQEGGDSLLDWFETYGIELAGSVEEAGDIAAAEAYSSGVEIVDGIVTGLSDNGQTAVDAALEVTGLTAEQFGGLVEKAGISGEDAIIEFANALEAGTSDSQTAALSNADVVREALASSDGAGAGAEVIGDYAQSLNDGKDESETAADANADAVEDALLLTDGTTPGAKAASAFATAIRRGVNESGNAGTANATSADTGFSSSNAGRIGDQMVTDFYTSIGAGRGKSKTSGTDNASAAASGFQSQTGNANTWGNHLGGNFANGISSAIDLAKGAATSLANAVASVLGHSIPKEEPLRQGGQGEKRWGLHLVQNIVEGMRLGEDDLYNEAERMAEGLEEVFDGVVYTFDAKGQAIAKGVVVGFEKEDPLSQLEKSITKGVASLNIAVQSGAGSTYNTTTNNQNNYFNAPVVSAESFARDMRLQQYYGLAGKFI